MNNAGMRLQSALPGSICAVPQRLAGIRVAFGVMLSARTDVGFTLAPHVSVDLVLVSADMGFGGHTYTGS